MMPPTRLIKHFIVCLCCLSASNLAQAEPLRIFVPSFFGPKPISQHVRTTIYFGLSQAFRSKDMPEKGAWILYGIDELNEQSHDAAITASSWPSVRADLAVWGLVRRYDDGVVVQLFLTITPLIRERRVRPEYWTVIVPDANGKTFEIARDIPGLYYEFEPLTLKKRVVIEYEKPEGIPLYGSRYGGEIRGYLGEIIYFSEIYDDALLLQSNGVEGWVRLPKLSSQRSEAVSFVKGMVRLLRGDWRGCLEDFAAVLSNANIPQNLRIDALLYTGLAKEKTGESGRQEFERAYQINRLDKSTVSYLLMSRIADIVRARRRNDEKRIDVSIHKFREAVKSTRVLFAENDKWFQKIESFLK